MTRNLVARLPMVMPLVTLILAAGAGAPANAQVVIRNVPVGADDVGRVQRQCDALRSRAMRSLIDDDGDPPPPGVIISDPANAWADGADGTDSALAKIDLSRLTLKDCRQAGL